MFDTLSALNWVDYIVILGLLRGAYAGYRDGVLAELFRIAVIVLTFFVTLQLSKPIAQYVNLYTPFDFNVARTFTVAVLAIVIYLVLRLIVGFLLKFLEVGESLLIKALGLVVGMMRWSFIVSVLFMLIIHSGVDTLTKDITDKSQLASPIAKIAPTSLDFLSSFFG